MNYVYALICPLDKKVKWYGVSNNPSLRLRNHKKESGESNRLKFEWIQNLKSVNQDPVLVVIAEYKDRTQAFECEEFLCRQTDGILNRNMGPKKCSESLQVFSSKMRGRKWSEIQREKILKKIRSPEHRKIVAARSKQTTAKLRKPVVDSDGVEYESVCQASVELKIHRANITAVLAGRRKTASGMTFRFKEQE